MKWDASMSWTSNGCLASAQAQHLDRQPVVFVVIELIEATILQCISVQPPFTGINFQQLFQPDKF
jgi:hypothetical protein